MPMHRLLLLALPLLAAGCANSTTDSAGDRPRNERDAQRLAAAQPSGAPINCVNRNRIRTTHVLSDSVIDFELTDGSVLRNTLPQSCSGLGFNEAFSYSTSLSQLCSLEIITVIEQTGGPRRGASCGLGQFQPVSFPEGTGY
jgi:hypothetical protein